MSRGTKITILIVAGLIVIGLIVYFIIVPVFKEMGLWHSINSKNNMGLGEPHYKFYDDEP